MTMAEYQLLGRNQSFLANCAMVQARVRNMRMVVSSSFFTTKISTNYIVYFANKFKRYVQAFLTIAVAVAAMISKYTGLENGQWYHWA